MRSVIKAVFVAAALSGLPVLPSSASETETAFLNNYVGRWTGRGELRGETTETIACRLDIEPASDGQVRYDGRCAIAGETIPLDGRIRYSDENGRYEASGQNLGAVAGEARNGGVAFTFGDEYRREGRSGTFRVRFVLARDAITIDFAIADRENGNMQARVPLSR